MNGWQQLAGWTCLLLTALLGWFMYLYMVYEHKGDKKL
jgi:hypothetical protein